MDKKFSEILSLHSESEKDISNLETELNHFELKKKKLLCLVTSHLTKICPQYCKRIFRDHPSFFDPNNISLEKIFIDQEELCRDILGYSFQIKQISFEEQEGKLMKKWEVEGEVGENSFIANFMTETGISNNLVKENDTSPSVSIQSLEIFPTSDEMNNLSEHLLRSNHLKILVPNLNLYQTLKRKRKDVVNRLMPFIEVTITEDNGTIFVSVKMENLNFSLHWSILFEEHNYKFSDSISIETKEMNVSAPECQPYFTGKKSLCSSVEVNDFFEKLFHL